MRTQRAGQSALLLVDAVEILGREKVDYAVIGAFALAIYGTVRASMDADALLFTTPKRMGELRVIFDQKGFDTELRRGDTDDPIPSMLTLTDRHENRVDLLGGLRGLDPNTLSRTVEVSFQGSPLRIVSCEDLIAMKCFAGGPQDVLDAISAYQNARPPVNLDLLRSITRRFGREAADKLERVLGQRDR